MSIVIQFASWAATGYLSYSFYQTASHVYTLWSPPSCNPSDPSGDCLCPSYDENTNIHFEIYLSKKRKLAKDFQSSKAFNQIYSSALNPSDDNDNSDVKVSFDSQSISHNAFVDGMSKNYKLHQNKSQIYAHIVSYMPPGHSSDYATSSAPTDSIFSFISIPVTYHAAPPPNTFSLTDGKSGKAIDDNQNQNQEQRKLYESVQYFVPNLTVFYVVDYNCYPRRQLPGDIYPYLRSQRSRNAGQNDYDPIIFSSNLFQMHKYALPIMDANGDLLSNTEHTDFKYDLKNLTMQISIEPVSLGLFRLYLMMDHQNKAMEHEWGFTQHDQDQIKGLFVDTPPLLTFCTFAAAMLHSIFGVLAMKNDISFWYTKDGADSLKGLSTNSVLFQLVSSIVITIYLIDSDQTNKIVLFFAVAECCLGLWKVQRIRNIKKKADFKKEVADYEISDDESSDSDSDDSDGQEGQKKILLKKRQIKAKKKEEKKVDETPVVSEDTVKTESLDQKATRYMLIAMIPVVIGYAIYAFCYHKHKSWLSFIINVSASCVYGLGFIHLCPQLFINYELQSVDSLPWRVLIYKFFNTFVDDLFSFVIDMPLMHRLACFRDDIVFFVFLWQWYKYGSKKRKSD